MCNDFTNKKINDWYHLYSNEVYQYIFFMIQDHEQAKDVMQDTFLRAYHSLQSFDGENAKGWLFRIARNLTIDEIRKKNTLRLLINKIASTYKENTSTEQLVTFNETERELYLALCKLKQSYRHVIVLRKLNEFSIKETATILGWSESKVKSNLQRGLKALKKEMRKAGSFHETI